MGKLKNYFCIFLLAASSFGIISSGAQASPKLEELRTETRGHLQRFASGKLRCFPEIKSGVEAHIVHTYKGSRLVEKGLGGHPYKYLDIVVGKTEKPALLVFSAYEPVVWRIKVKPGANIAGIYMTGYYEQMITGLPLNIPVARNHYRFRSGKEKEKCSLEEINASGQLLSEPSKDNIQEKINKLQREFLPIIKKLRGYPAKVSAYGEIRDKLSAEPVHEKAVILIDGLLAKMEQELPEIKKQALELQTRLAEIYNNKPNFIKTSKAGFGRYALINNAAKLEKFEKLLANEKSITVASYQSARGKRIINSSTVISSEIAEQFRVLKAKGKERLKNLELPQFDLVGLSKAPLAAPSDYIAGGGIKYLVQKGYLVNGNSAHTYNCEKTTAYAATKGFVGGKCGVRGVNTFTIVGPIVFPVGLCGGHSVTFYMPPGVPEPEGNACHSAVHYLSEKKPCLADSGTCRMRDVKKRRSN